MVYACGVCVDYQLDFLLPFLKILKPIFIIWLLIKIILGIIGRFTATSIPFFITRFSLLFIVSLFIAASFLSMGSVLFPFLTIVIPSWFISVYKSQKKLYSVRDRKILQNIFVYFQWLIVLVTFSAMIYSFATFTSTKRLLKKLDYSSNFTLPAQKMLVRKGFKISSEIIQLVKNFNFNTMRHVDQFINLMKVIREINDPSLAPVINAKFQKLKYIDDFYITEIYTETAKTLIVLDKKNGPKIILQKLKEIADDKDINRYYYKNIANGLIESIPENDIKIIVKSYQILGAPDLGTDLEAYKAWWNNTKKKDNPALNSRIAE